ncbi:hypothetical protein AMTRI_Chr08g207560 [Amborella trichopoda]
MDHVEQLYAGCSWLCMHILREFKNLGIWATSRAFRLIISVFSFSYYRILWWKRDQFINVNLILIFITQHSILEKKYFNMKRLIIINGIFCGFWPCNFILRWTYLSLSFFGCLYN